jgi:hypothetical protein
MELKVELDKAYIPSEEVVARVIEGEMIIVPLTSGIGDMEDELFSLNATGRAVWDRLNGRDSLQTIIADLDRAYEARPNQIEQDVLGLMEELARRKMVVSR